LFGTLTSVNLAVWLAGTRTDGPADIVLLAAITSLPIFPIVGFHINQAFRQFRAGHTLSDLRSALEIERRERAETEALIRNEGEPRTHRLRIRHRRLGNLAREHLRAVPPGCHPRKPRAASCSSSRPCSALWRWEQ
jgi:hypothetical protein